ncbi:hypothetical protein HU200_048949 [Digitaria exilis]|uniref:Uncharacterized protein n=1 Tax=Digitaria exilis TaxID=1010633 RepID=A0A835ARU2_9POAL|nr:hypothetical protein HU200_048949 [Digitaria exilis]
MGFATSLLGCRHGRVLLLATSPDKVLTSLFVCDLVTDGHIQLVIPVEFTGVSINGTVLCAAGNEEGHVHGACHWSPFKVVLVAVSRNGGRPMACAYSSETGLWGNIIRHDRPGMFIDSDHSSTLIAHAIYWKIMSFGTEEVEEDMLEFDFDRQTLTVIKGLPGEGFDQSRIIRVLDDHMGIATLSYPTSHLRVWHWNANGGRDGVATWVLAKTVDLQSIFGLQEHETLPLSPRRDSILGYDEDDGVIFIHVQPLLLEVMEIKG